MRTGSARGLDAAENPAAFPLVVDRVLKGLPYDEETVGELLTGLGSMARTTVTNEDAATCWRRSGASCAAWTFGARPSPSRTCGRARPGRRHRVRRSHRGDRELFPLALLEPGQAGTPRVVLQRAGATIGAATAARLSLVGAGFGVVQDRTEVEPVVTTQVLVPDSSEAALAAGSEVAAVLGLRRLRCPLAGARRPWSTYGRPGAGHRHPRPLIGAGRPLRARVRGWDTSSPQQKDIRDRQP